MAYNQSAEAWGLAAAGEPGSRLFDKAYCELADVVWLDHEVKIPELVGKLDCMKHYAPKSQGDMLRVVFRDMAKLTGDRLVKENGLWKWRLEDREV